MDKFENETYEEIVSEEEMREMARRYAQELLSQGVEPSEQDRVMGEAKHSSHEPVTHVGRRAARHSAAAEPVPELREAEEPKKGLLERGNSRDKAEAKTAKSRGKARGKAAAKAADPETDLSKLKKVDLLEIMLKQGEEIDALRTQVASLEAQLADRRLTLSKCGSIAEASLAITEIFKEAERAADIYLENVKRAAREEGAIEALRTQKALEAAAK